MRVAVCDDNKIMLDFILGKVDEKLSKLGIDYEISGFEYGMDLIAQHEKTPFDVMFLDIKLTDIDGFEAAKLAKKIFEKTHIIFITTESDLVYDSFDYHPYYFIPKSKPEFLARKIGSVIEKLVDKLNEKQTIFFDLPHNEKKYVDSDKIIYIASKSNYVDVVCREETIHIRFKLDDMFIKLPAKSFARIHNRYILNMHYLGRIDSGRYKAVLYDGTELDISRAYKAALINKYTVFLRNFS